MSVEFGSVPLPESPIYEYWERRFSGSSQSQNSAPSPSTVSSLDEKALEERLLGWTKHHDVDDERRSTDNGTEMEGLLEAQELGSLEKDTVPLEYSVPLAKKLTFLGLYFFLNITLTLSNKDLLLEIKAPWLLTVMHATATTIGCWLLVATGHLKLTKLGRKEHLILLAFSSLFTLNIATSNVSLSMVSVPFHQVMRSTCPIVTVLIYRIIFKRSYQTQTYLSMIPLILGVGLATLGDYSCTIGGFLVTVLGVLLAATKSITTNRLMTGPLALSPLELLTRMSPLAAVQCLFYAIINGEISKIDTVSRAGGISMSFVIAVIGNASVALLLNIVSFQTNKYAGALTMSICGNVKQCLTIALGIVLFDVRMTILNNLGIVVAAGGAAWYSSVELRSRKSS